MANVSPFGGAADAVESMRMGLDLLSLLSELEFGVAEPLPSESGVLVVDGVVVQRWIGGRQPSGRADWRLVADELRRLHRMTAYIPQRPGCCAVTQLRSVLRSVDADLGLLTGDVRYLVVDAFEQFDDAPVSVIHGDPGAPNVRLDDSGRGPFSIGTRAVLT